MISTDYLVIGGGAAGMAFTDSLVAESAGAEVVIVDRRDRPGGHWNDVYPFVRLHQPAAYYGVNSRPLGTDAIEADGPNAGMYEQSNAGAILDYFHRVLTEVLLPSGRVTFLGMHDHVGATGDGNVHQLVSRLTGRVTEVEVRRRVVDARYQETAIPATHAPSFAVEPGATVIPVNDLVRIDRPADRYVVIGAGKTAMDACGWLLRHDVDPAGISWIRPRDGWFWNRAMTQPREQVASIMEGAAADLEAAAVAESPADLAVRLEACERLFRLDGAVEPTMFRCATMSRAEIDELRCIDDVVRLGHVRSVGADRIVLAQGEVPTTSATIHVDCTASGLRINPPRPVFEPGRITIQEIRTCQPTFNAALIGFVEATYGDDDRRNALCPPNPYPSTVEDMARTILRQQLASNAWSADAEMLEWLGRSRLNAVRDVYDRFDDRRVQAAVGRYLAANEPAIANLRRMLGVAA